MNSIAIVLREFDGQKYAPADAVQSLIHDYERAMTGLLNCALLAAKHRKEDGDWQHIIRFCLDAGARADILRTTAPDQPTGGAE